jgi:hypothetical protein
MDQDSQLTRAVERVRAEGEDVDPEACAARFGSAL